MLSGLVRCPFHLHRFQSWRRLGEFSRSEEGKSPDSERSLCNKWKTENCTVYSADHWNSSNCRCGILPSGHQRPRQYSAYFEHMRRGSVSGDLGTCPMEHLRASPPRLVSQAARSLKTGIGQSNLSIPFLAGKTLFRSVGWADSGALETVSERLAGAALVRVAASTAKQITSTVDWRSRPHKRRWARVSPSCCRCARFELVNRRSGRRFRASAQCCSCPVYTS